MTSTSARLPCGLIDTSVLIASESGRRLDADRLPDLAFVSVVTLAELRAGVLAARDTITRARRMNTLTALAGLAHLPVDEVAAGHWATLRVRLDETGRRINVNDLWIAATALAHDLPVITQDDDFVALEGLGGPLIVMV